MTGTKPPAQTALALWYVAPRRMALLEEPLRRRSAAEAKLDTLYSAVSRGTELLVYSGTVPETEWQRLRAPFQDGSFSFPLKYGYCAVGLVQDGPQELLGRVAFCLHPHQDHFIVPVDAVTTIPKGIPPKRATLAANMETALNAHWDAATKPGDRVIVIGGGIVGLLIGYLATRIVGTDVSLVDTNGSRRQIAEQLGIAFGAPDAALKDADVVFHASATEAGLRGAITAAGDEGKVVEVSWYGTREVSLALGAEFHAKRLQLVSSQVGRIGHGRDRRWSMRRRLSKAISLLDDPVLDALVEAEIPFRSAPDLLPGVFDADARELPPVLSYDATDT